MTSPLERLKDLVPEAPDAAEFAGLVKGGLARLRDATSSSLSPESRFDLAYGAAHALSLAALRHHGFRSKNRYLVFQVLPHTLGLAPEVWRVLAKCRDLRNKAEYEGEVEIDGQLLEDLIAACGIVAKAVSGLKAGK